MAVAFALLDALLVGVLSIGKLSAARADYYVAAVAHGAEDYYTGRGEVPGYWIGTAATRLGLVGEVGDGQFRTMLHGVNPSDGTALARANRRVAAFDLTFSAPKSVSVLWALGGPEIARAVVAAHEDALAGALGYLEREAVFVRRGRDGTERLVGGGVVGAAFRHRTSRAGDPQLHTHVVVANATRGPDGAWSALDGRHLYAQARTAGFLYQAGLRTGLYQGLGVHFGPVLKGTADVVGIPVDVLREFSQRRAEIESALRPGDSASTARRVTLATRRAKERDVDPETLYSGWADRARQLGFTRAAVEALCPGPPRTRRPAVQVTVPSLGETLTEHASSFDRRDVLQTVAAAATGGATVAELEAVADGFLGSDRVVALGVGPYGIRYSTPELLAIETRLVKDALARRHDHVGIVEDLEPVLAQHPELSREQRRMVRTLTRDGAGVAVVIGAAGAGKTHALAAARDAWHNAGYAVIGTALAARAARQLADGAGIPAATLDALLLDLDRPDTPGLGERMVVVVDEAAMVGTRHLARLADHVARAGAKVVLVGDHRQLPEIDAGGAFVALARRLEPIRLVENRRQHDPTQRAALQALRHGHVEDALALFEHLGHLTETNTPEEARERMVRDWYGAIRRGEDVVMLASHRVDVADLNHRARALLRRSQHVSTTEIYAAGRSYAPGDRIVTLRNDRRVGLINGQRGSVVHSHRLTRSLLVSFDDEQHTRTIPTKYLDDGHVEHAYAMTIHKAQGLTCDRAYMLASDQLHAEAGYTALTRGRHENHLYLISSDHQRDGDHHDNDHQAGGIDAIRSALGRSTRGLAAIDLRTLPNLDAHRADRDPGPIPAEHDDGVDLGW